MACNFNFDLFPGKNQKNYYFTLSLCLVPLFNFSSIKKGRGLKPPPFIGFVFKRLA